MKIYKSIEKELSFEQLAIALLKICSDMGLNISNDYYYSHSLLIDNELFDIENFIEQAEKNIDLLSEDDTVNSFSVIEDNRYI